MSKAIRSNDLDEERWDLLSGAACRELYMASGVNCSTTSKPIQLVEDAINFTQAFLGYDGVDDRLSLLTTGWWRLASAIQLLDMPPGQLTIHDNCRHYPYYAMKRLSRTCCEGGTKYAEENWHNGFTIKGLANHAIAHMVSWTNGRTPLSTFWKDENGSPLPEDELGHAMWAFMAMTHVWLFRQDKCTLLLGRNYSITEELKQYHDEHASRKVVHA